MDAQEIIDLTASDDRSYIVISDADEPQAAEKARAPTQLATTTLQNGDSTPVTPKRTNGSDSVHDSTTPKPSDTTEPRTKKKRRTKKRKQRVVDAEDGEIVEAEAEVEVEESSVQPSREHSAERESAERSGESGSWGATILCA